MIVIADIMADVVARVSYKVFNTAAYAHVKAAIQEQLSNQVNQLTFLHGHPNEIVNVLAQMDQSGILTFNRYPLFAMFQDMDEQPVNGMMQANLQFIIATQTKQEYTAAQRYPITFKPILYPLYQLFLQEIKLHKSIQASYTIDHTKYDRVFWGSVVNSEGTFSIFNDYLDAIEIQNMKLTFINNNCSN